MRYSREHSEATRKRILGAAARLYREGGLAGTGVDAVAQAAGVTSGAIYRAFGSKEKLFEAVVQDGVERLSAGIVQLRRAQPDGWPAALAGWYLGPQHVGSPGQGCLLPTLTPDVARGGEAARILFQEGARRAAAAADSAGPADGSDAGAAGGKAPASGWATLSLLAGAVLLARAAGPGPVQDEILSSAAAAMEGMAQEGTGGRERQGGG
ncbi:TetR/AcrR family transcriptional regulator [Marinibaculum pumilum]|uniref:TetR/AcrR family transcriptional regulator n=1 Tax=Marinibaculum pumilum TaxID=1766165 RepID=A0ABV7L3M6_9PROT